MTDVVLINAPWKKDYNRCGRWGGRTISLSKNPPVYYLYAGAILEQNGHSVSIIDALAENITLQELSERVAKENPELVVIESNCASVESDLECAKQMKLIGVPKVGLSGMMATSNHKNLLFNNRFLDFCLLGEYDYTIPKLLESKSYKTMDGVSFRKNGFISFGKKENYIKNLDLLPFPAYHLVNPKLYDEIIIQKRPFVQSIESRSCPFNCTFCISHIMFGKKWRAMSAKRIVDEMEYWEDKGMKEIFWDGETFTIDKKRCHDVCSQIKERGLNISWSCLSRADTVTPKMLAEMADANCVLIRYGFESANQNILNFIRKGYPVKQNLKTAEWTRDVGILVHGAWMFVPPLETEMTVKKTVEMAKKTSDTAQFTICTPYFGTDYYKLCKQKGWLLTEDWSKYLASDESVVKSDIDLGVMVEKAYKSFYVRPSYLLGSLRRELQKGTIKKSLKIALRVVGVSEYW
jgi:anaerobic magnesium-protoporphyrin IX monomethyl ester cyclase